MTPDFSISDVMNGRWFDAVLRGNFFYRDSSKEKLPYFPHLSFRQFVTRGSLATTHQIVLPSMPHIFLASYPLKIVGVIVFWIAVLVVNFAFGRTWPNECFGDKMVNVFSVVIPKTNNQSSISVNDQFPDFSWNKLQFTPIFPVSLKRTNAPKIGHLVLSLVPSYRSPLFGYDGFSHLRSFQRRWSDPASVTSAASGSPHFNASGITIQALGG